MKKRKKTKKTFAIIAIFLFIAPLFLNAYINVANYIESKNRISETANATDNKNEQSPKDNDETQNN